MRILPALGVLIVLVASCGYNWQYDRGEDRLETGSLPNVAVLPFDTVSYRRGIEIRLTRLIDDEIRARSPRAPSSPDEADWLLEGTVVFADERVLSEDEDDRVRESSFVVHVKVVLKERTTEKVLRTYTFRETEPFSDRAGRVGTFEQAQEEALRDVAESIVYWLEASHPERT